MSSSYNGWPADRNPDVIDVGDFRYRNRPFPAGVKRGDVAVVFTYLVNALATRVEPFNDGYGMWGFNYRANVNNPSSLSCHASGTAIDWRAPDHPNGVSGTFTAAQYAEIGQILQELDSVVRHLRGYDEMHFEIRGSAAQVKAVADKIRYGTVGKYTPPEEPAMALSDQDKAYIAQKLNESEGQIMGAIRRELAEAVETITGGVRTRDAKGNVIDSDPGNVSEADSFTRLERMEQTLNAILAKHR